uniref:GON-4-like protein n=1 Tax=Rhabditophanes sp. KR3021 TaxID=114890 RepID=A0AC35TSJ6_9BILA
MTSKYSNPAIKSYEETISKIDCLPAQINKLLLIKESLRKACEKNALTASSIKEKEKELLRLVDLEEEDNVSGMIELIRELKTVSKSDFLAFIENGYDISDASDSEDENNDCQAPHNETDIALDDTGMSEPTTSERQMDTTEFQDLTKFLRSNDFAALDYHLQEIKNAEAMSPTVKSEFSKECSPFDIKCPEPVVFERDEKIIQKYNLRKSFCYKSNNNTFLSDDSDSEPAAKKCKQSLLPPQIDLSILEEQMKDLDTTTVNKKYKKLINDTKKRSLLLNIEVKISSLLEKSIKAEAETALDLHCLAKHVKLVLHTLGITQKQFAICVANQTEGRFSELLLNPHSSWVGLRAKTQAIYTRMFAFLINEEAIKYLFSECSRKIRSGVVVPEVYCPETFWAEKPLNYSPELYPPREIHIPASATKYTPSMQTPSRPFIRRVTADDYQSSTVHINPTIQFSSDPSKVPRVQFLKTKNPAMTISSPPSKFPLNDQINVFKVCRETINLLNEARVNIKKFGEKFSNLDGELFLRCIRQPVNWDVATNDFKLIYMRLKKFLENETLVSKLRREGLNGLPLAAPQKNNQSSIVPIRKNAFVPHIAVNTKDTVRRFKNLCDKFGSVNKSFYFDYVNTPYAEMEKLLNDPIDWSECNTSQMNVYVKLSKLTFSPTLQRTFLRTFPSKNVPAIIPVKYIKVDSRQTVLAKSELNVFSICQGFLNLLNESKTSITQFGEQYMKMDGVEFELALRQPQPWKQLSLDRQKCYLRLKYFMNSTNLVSVLKTKGIAGLNSNFKFT